MVMARRGRGMRGEGGGERRKSETRDRTDQMGRDLTADFTDCSDCPDSGEGNGRGEERACDRDPSFAKHYGGQSGPRRVGSVRL
jgi:hypothetical protein